MKKTLLIFAICLGISISFTSCKDKEHKHSEDTHMHDDTEEATNEKEVASNTLYQCTMDCEKGKSYIKEGSCPVCRMDLTPKEVKMDSDSEKEVMSPLQDNVSTRDLRAKLKLLAEHVELIDVLYPKTKISLLVVHDDFNPGVVEWLSNQLNIPTNAMFISCPDETFSLKLTQLKGMRIVTHNS